MGVSARLLRRETGGAAVDLGSAPAVATNTLYNLYLTPHRDEVVSCGRGLIQAAPVPW